MTLVQARAVHAAAAPAPAPHDQEGASRCKYNGWSRHGGGRSRCLSRYWPRLQPCHDLACPGGLFTSPPLHEKEVGKRVGNHLDQPGPPWTGEVLR